MNSQGFELKTTEIVLFYFISHVRYFENKVTLAILLLSISCQLPVVSCPCRKYTAVVAAVVGTAAVGEA